MIYEKQQSQVDIENIVDLPPLIDDFDSWEEIWRCNCSLVSSQHYQFQGLFSEHGLLIGEQVKGDTLLPDPGDVFCCFENRGVEHCSSGSTVLNGLIENGEKKNDESLKRKKYGSERGKEITFVELSKYFYMPITQAAKKMDVGLTVLKKKCREYGIPRWPHRKMKSLRSLIRSVQELGEEDGKVGEDRSRLAIEALEEQVKQMEMMPAMQLPENTKRLRQACFKANYKKRRLMGQLVENHYSTSLTDQYTQSSL
ncbi:RKD1 protein [Nymphaea thermarum]|nr:RKD1 protein [Nymphaea thermarum]